MIASSIYVGEWSDGLVAFVGKCSLISTVLLHVEPLDLEAVNPLVELVRMSQPVCMLQGVSVDMDVFVTQLLDAGLLNAFFKAPTELEEVELLKRVLASFPSNRVGVSVEDPLSLELLALTLARYGDHCLSFSFRCSRIKSTSYSPVYRISETSSGEDVVLLLDELVKQLNVFKLTNFYVYLPSVYSVAEVSKICLLHDRLHAVVVPTMRKSVQSTEIIESPCQVQHALAASVRVDLIELFISTLRTDRPDGLFTTVVCDEHDVCLGLVYSNQESIRCAIVEGRGIYWSRSRGGLWRKGDTSGMHQELLAVRADCDGDALRFSVIQHGNPPAFCHLNTRTCWGHEHGVHKLQSILQDRLRSAPPGSYTKRLFDDPGFLQKKLLEEAQELMEAQEPDHIAAEAADVMYFMMTRCVAGGVTLRDIERHLDRRTLKVGLIDNLHAYVREKLLGDFRITWVQTAR